MTQSLPLITIRYIRVSSLLLTLAIILLLAPGDTTALNQRPERNPSGDPVEFSSEVHPSGEAMPRACPGGTEPDPDCNLYCAGHCTAYACLRAKATGWTGINGFGNAFEWDDNAPDASLEVGTVPMGGAIAVWDNCDDIAGHVAFVEAVMPNGDIHVTEYNFSCPLCWGERTISPPACLQYIYRPQPTLFDDADYAGAWRALGSGLSTFANESFSFGGYSAYLDNAVSSIWMPPDWSAFIYRDSSYGCGSVIVDCPNSNLHSILFSDGVVVGNNASSIKLYYATCVAEGQCGGVQADCTGPTGVKGLTVQGAESSHACPPPPPLPPPTPYANEATFISDVTIPDGTVVSPSQALHKVWRVRNSGTSTWGSGYQLVFTGGDQMGAPSAVDVPGTVSPEAVVDLAVDMIAPSSPNTYVGRWQLRNAQGVFFGDELIVDITVEGVPQEGAVTVLDVSYPTVVAPGEQFRPGITVRVDTGSLLESRGDLLRNTDGNLYGAWPHVAVVGSVYTGQEYTFRFYADNPITAPTTAGTYESRWRVWQDGRYVGQEVVLQFEVQPSENLNHPPNAPRLAEPGDWAVFEGSTPTLRAEHQGDPDGDSISHYYFEIFESHDIPTSGWITSSSWTPPGLGNYGYQWHVKVRDSRGAESGWSETRHFNIESAEAEIYDFHWEWCREAWGGPEKICFCADTNAGTLRVMVNAATDGSENGEWRIINELGVPDYPCSSDSDNPPNWGQLEAETGTHRARLFARKEGGWDAAATADILITLPADRRPNSPSVRQPTWEGYVSSQTVQLDWIDSLRTTEYRLLVGANPDPTQSPLLDVRLPVGTSQYTHTFDDDYETIYGNVIATGPYGTNEGGIRFHIDVESPISAVGAMSAVTTDTAFAVSWSGTDARSGLRWYDIQYRDGERGEWTTWFAQTEDTGALFRGEPGHTYFFRSRAMDEVGNWEAYPPGDGDTHTLVDPSAIPPTVWWNPDYVWKRNLVILNNDGDSLPAQYPMHVHFDGSTVPTAAEIYNGSLADAKGNDVRIIYQDQTELHRFVQRFTSTQIDIWFPLQAALGSGLTSSGDYQVYYGNAGAAAPPADVNAVFLPKADANTMGLWHFQEGSGGAVNDSSGRNHDGVFHNAGWADGYLGRTGSFNGSNAYVEVPHTSDLNLGAFTLEAWIYLDGYLGDHPMVISKDYYWLKMDNDRKLWFGINADGGNRIVVSNTVLSMDQWYHVAATYDGNGHMKIYLNGQEDGHRDESPLTILYTSLPFRIGRLSNIDPNVGRYFPGSIQHLRVSNVARTSFPYARIDVEASVQAGIPINPPNSGNPDLAILDLATYPSPDGGILVQAVVQNQGNRDTQNGFYTDLYANHQPAGPGDYTGSVRFWIASPIEASATITLTTVLADVSQLAQIEAASASVVDETTVTLYGQTDSGGVVAESDEADNISDGVDICIASPDVYEGDDGAGSAQPIALGETQSHNFDKPGDQDWVRFTADEGQTYTLQTSNLGPASDTYLYLYDTDGSTLLAANDDYGGSLSSQIEWEAPTGGTYFAKVSHWNPNAGGCGTSYETSVQLGAPRQYIHLPLVMSKYRPLYTVMVYGDEADGELGRIECDDWAACRNSSWGNFLLRDYGAGTVSASFGDPYFDVKRIFLFFDTSSLPANAVIEEATLGIYAGPFQSGSTLVHVVRSTAGIPLSNGDIDEIQSQSGGFTTLAPNAWSNIQLSTTALDWITTGGITKLALIHDRDLYDLAPDSLNNALVALAEDPDRRPYLALTYYVP